MKISFANKESRDIQKELTEEFAKVFTSLTSRVEVFEITQDSFIESLVPQIQEVMSHLSREELRNGAAIFGICMTDGVLANYSAKQFAQDVNYLMALLPKDTTSLVKPTLGNDVSLTERAAHAKAHKSAFMKLLTVYYQSMEIIETTINQFNKDLILHQINYREELVILSILIRQFLLPLYEHLYQLYKTVDVDVDLRFITAQAIYSILNLLEPKRETKSQAEIFENLVQTYPLGSGDDLYWDLAYTQLYSVYYPRLKDLLKDQIEAGRKKKQEALESIRAQMSVQQPDTDSDDNLRAKIDSIIFESVQFNRRFDGDKQLKLQRVSESVLKRLALREFGKQDIPNKKKYLDYFMQEFFPIFLEYPQFLLPFIDVRYYRAFSDDPLGHFEKQKPYIMNQFWFKMRKNGYVAGSSGPSEFAAAFAKLIFDILNDEKVRTFDV